MYRVSFSLNLVSPSHKRSVQRELRLRNGRLLPLLQMLLFWAASNLHPNNFGSVLDWLLREADTKVTVWKEVPITEETEQYGEEGREPKGGTPRNRYVLSLCACLSAESLPSRGPPSLLDQGTPSGRATGVHGGNPGPQENSEGRLAGVGPQRARQNKEQKIPYFSNVWLFPPMKRTRVGHDWSHQKHRLSDATFRKPWVTCVSQ